MKIINRWLRRRKYGYKHVPRQISIALTNRCNARCIYCGIVEKTINKDMPINVYKRIIDAMPFIDEVQPQIVGEPLLYPALIEAIKYAKKLDKKVVVYTNGSIFVSELARSLYKAGLDRLIFSIDDDHKEGFEALRNGLNWDKVLANVYNYRQIRDYEKAKTKLSVRICITDKNKDRIKSIRKFWWKYVDSVAAMPAIDVFAGKSEDIKRLKSSFTCPLLEDSIAIDADGRLMLCCRDWYGELKPKLGSIVLDKEITPSMILRLYNSPMMNLFRERLKNGIMVPELCYSCTYPYENMKW